MLEKAHMNCAITAGIIPSSVIQIKVKPVKAEFKVNTFKLTLIIILSVLFDIL